nr:MAG TPA: hypothetical protein [Caudoviricetes sp.]
MQGLMDSGGFNPRTPCGVRRSFHGGQGAAAGFNPRTPCGVRHRFKPGRVIKCRFQSTHSLRSATAAHHRQTAQKTGFNPRTPCGVRLFGLFTAFSGGRCFNPRTPCGVRRMPLPLS